MATRLMLLEMNDALYATINSAPLGGTDVTLTVTGFADPDTVIETAKGDPQVVPTATIVVIVPP